MGMALLNNWSHWGFSSTTGELGFLTEQQDSIEVDTVESCSSSEAAKRFTIPDPSITQADSYRRSQLEPLTEKFGHWESPISAEALMHRKHPSTYMQADGDELYFLDPIPGDSGAQGIWKLGEDSEAAWISYEAEAIGSKVNNYGGAPFAVHEGSMVYSSSTDQKVYFAEAGGSPRAITEGFREIYLKGKRVKVGTHYAEFIFSKHGIYALCHELHDKVDVNGKQVESQSIVLLKPKDGSRQVVAPARRPSRLSYLLASGRDFYRSLTLSPDERELAFICYNFPSMPWFDTELWRLSLHSETGKATSALRVGGAANETVYQPQYGPDGVLYVGTDRGRSERVILHRLEEQGLQPLSPSSHHILGCQWFLRPSSYAFLGKRTVVYTAFNPSDGLWKLFQLDTRTKKIQAIPREGASMFTELRSTNNGVAFVERYFDRQSAIVHMDHSGAFQTLHGGQDYRQYRGSISRPKHFSFPTSKKGTAYAYYYPPLNKDYRGPKGAKPPVIVMNHGGPTAQLFPHFDEEVQYWTSRGFAVVHVNYRGSTGYGRKYRYALNDKWGRYDVDDSAFVVKQLKKEGLVDGQQVIIRGASAGGFTVLGALAFHPQDFQIGLSRYGVADAKLLDEHTHYFESRYMELLIAPKDWQRYSPIHSVDKIRAAVLITQGDQDPIVPPAQATEMYKTLKKAGRDVELHMIKGEEHGFKKPVNFIASVEKELDFVKKRLKN